MDNASRNRFDAVGGPRAPGPRISGIERAAAILSNRPQGNEPPQDLLMRAGPGTGRTG